MRSRSDCATMLALSMAALVAPACRAEQIAYTLTTGAESIGVGETVQVDLYVQDLRPDPSGVFSAYVDMTYPAAFLQIEPGTFRFQGPFGSIPSADLSVPGILNELGSFASEADTIDWSQPVPMMSFALRAIAPGEATLEVEPADILPLHATTLSGSNLGIGQEETRFAEVTITVVPEPVPVTLLTLTCALTTAFRGRDR